MQVPTEVSTEMHRIEVNNIINKIIAVFRIFGLWDDDHRITKRKLFSLILMANFVTSVILGAFESDVDQFVFLIAAGCTHAVQFIKLVHIIWKKNQIFEFIHKSGAHIVQDYEKFTQINNKINKFTKPAACILLVIFLTCIVVLICYGILGGKDLPAKIAFPMDWKNSEIGYWCAFTFFVVALVYSMVIFLFNVIIWYVMLSFSIEYQLLGDNLRRLGVHNCYVKYLITVIENHRNLRE